METSFPFVEVPPELFPVLGRPDPGTRIYRREGSEEESGPWFEAMHEVVGPAVSPGGVIMYCPVSRAAVHKRLKEGRLSAFMFHQTHQATNLFGKKRTLRGSPLCYIPTSECKAWKAELEDEAVRRGRITRDELEGAKPDWEGEFLQWKNKSERYYGKGLLTEMLEGLTMGQKVTVIKALLTKSNFKIVHRTTGKEIIVAKGDEGIFFQGFRDRTQEQQEHEQDEP